MEQAKRKSKLHNDNVFAWCFFGPVSVYFFIFNILPVFFVLFISFTEWNGLDFRMIHGNGFNNYIAFFTQWESLRLLINTVIMGVIILALTILVGFCVATLMVKSIKFRAFHRVSWYIPGIVSFAIISQIVSDLLLPDGSLNEALKGMGLQPVTWTASTFWMFFWIIIISVWRGLGGTMLLFIAGLNNISKDYYEVGKIEGANRRQRLAYITLPLLRPMTVFILITSMIGMFNIFEPVKLISLGGPRGTTEVIMYQIYSEAFQSFRMGMSSAISVIVMIIVMALTVVNLRMNKVNLYY